MYDLETYALETAAHEAGHMVILFEAGRLKSLDFLPQELGADGNEGVFESRTVTPPGKGDCVAFAGGVAGERIYFGHNNPNHALDDRQQVQLLVGKDLDDFVPEAEKIITRDLRFFSLLVNEIRDQILMLLLTIQGSNWKLLPPRMPIYKRDQVEQIHRISQPD